MEKEELRAHLTTRDTWIRGLYILLFAVLYSIAELVLAAVVIFQFLARLITGEVNQRLLEFGQQLSSYLYDMLRFFTFNSDKKPYPFAPWNTADEVPTSAADPAGGASSARTPTPKSTVKKRAAPKKRAVTARRTTAKKASSKSTDQAEGGPSRETPPGDDSNS